MANRRQRRSPRSSWRTSSPNEQNGSGTAPRTLADIEGTRITGLILIDCAPLLSNEVDHRARDLLALGEHRLAMRLIAAELTDGTGPVPAATCDLLRHLHRWSGLDLATISRLRARSAQGPPPDLPVEVGLTDEHIESAGLDPGGVALHALDQRGYGISGAGWTEDQGRVVLQVALHDDNGREPRVRSIDSYPVIYTAGLKYVGL